MLDASVSPRWFLDNPMPAYARPVQQLLLGSKHAVDPPLWLLEMANGFVVAERRGAMSAADADRSMDNVEQLLRQALEVDLALFSARESLATARTFRLSAYDAAYLDLARREGLPIATLNDALRTAAARSGVALVRGLQQTQPSLNQPRHFARLRKLNQAKIAIMAGTATVSFERTQLGRTGLKVGRLGVSASYGVPGEAIERAFERGVNYFFWGSRRTEAFGAGLKRLRTQRERVALVMQSYTRVGSLMSGSLERGLRTLDFDYTDVLLLGLWNKPVPARILDAARRLKERGLARYLGVSTHKRAMVPQFGAGNDFDVVHFRYNAAHPGAETDIFPRLSAAHRPGLVAFTATSWRQLLGQGTLQGILPGAHRLPKSERVPTAADCYRYVLTRPEVDVCVTGPANAAQMDQALEALQLGPMNEDELAWMRRVGRAVAGK